MSRPVGIRNSFPVGNNLTRWLARRGWSPWYILWCQSLGREPAIRVVLDLGLARQLTRAFRRSFLVPNRHSRRIGNRCGTFSVSGNHYVGMAFLVRRSGNHVVSRVRYAPHNRPSMRSWHLVVLFVLSLMLVFF